MPNNIFDSTFESFAKSVIPVCQKRNIGVVGMKGCGGDGRLIADGLVTVEECYRYCLSQPVSTQVVGLASEADLERAIKIARSFTPMPDSELRSIQQKHREVISDGRYERFKTTQAYDSGHHRKQHGFA
jgi:predicted aldo/keto reductase-like oxidoreductase